jgi:hypothetical protein
MYGRKAQTAPAIARWLGIEPDKVVLISEYIGGRQALERASGDRFLRKTDGLLIGEENQQVNRERPGALHSAGDFITGAT